MGENRIAIVLTVLLVMFGMGAGGFALYTGDGSRQAGPEVAREESPEKLQARLAAKLQARLETARGELKQAREILDDVFGHPVEPAELQTLQVTITAYSSTEDQCDSTPYIAANNKPVRVGALAVSRDLQKEFAIEYGQRVLIPGYGVFEVCDTMNPRWQRRVDIWESDRQAALMFGKRQGKLIWMPVAQKEEMVTVARAE